MMTATRENTLDKRQPLDIDALAAQLVAATNTCTPISLLSERFPGPTIDGAYGIQTATRARLLASGQVLRGA